VPAVDVGPGQRTALVDALQYRLADVAGFGVTAGSALATGPQDSGGLAGASRFARFE
jgi:hypothetical protein